MDTVSSIVTSEETDGTCPPGHAMKCLLQGLCSPEPGSRGASWWRFRLGGRDGPYSWQSYRTRLGSLDFMGKRSEVTVLLEDGEVRPVFKGALHWGERLHAGTSIRHPSLSLMRAWGRGGGESRDLSWTHLQDLGTANKSDKGLRYICAGSFCLFVLECVVRHTGSTSIGQNFLHVVLYSPI